jgi:hypothetical protein
MKNIENDIGENAGKIWHALQDQGPLPQTKLLRTTRLTNEQLCEALGWLAREDKILKKDLVSGTMYQLGATNLTGKIGTDAGKIWKALQVYGMSTSSQLARFTHLSPEEVYAGIGWLARENKLQSKNENHIVKFSLIQ